VAVYRRKHSEVKLTLIDRPSFVGRQLLEGGGADLGILGLARGDDPMPQFQSWPLASFPFQLICPADHPLATARRLTLADIAKNPLVLSGEDSSSHRQIRHVFAQAGLADRMNVTTTATNRALLLDYVAIRLGITICTSANKSKLPKPGPGECELTMRDATALFGHEDVFFLQRKGRHELPHVRAFRELVLKSFG
jgi:DNA-binding transcriptional LysR family regulator